MNIEAARDLTNQITNYPLIYVSGAYRASNGDGVLSNPEVISNIEHAKEVAKYLWESGVGVLCPHANTAMDFTNCKPEIFLHSDLKMQMSCDGILMLNGWESSEGARLEKKFAEEIGQPVFYERDIERIHSDLVGLVKYPNQFLSMRILQSMSYFLHIKKNKDYGKMSILGTGIVGLGTRLWDKMTRMMELLGFDITTGEYSKPKEPKNESLLDTFVDLANYCLIAIIYKFNMWGK